MVREIIAWCDKTQKEADASEVLDSKTMAKYAKVGAVEGAVDGAVVVGVLCAAVGVVKTVYDLCKK